MKTLKELTIQRFGWLTEEEIGYDIYQIVKEWLMQERSYPKPNGATVQELLEELK